MKYIHCFKWLWLLLLIDRRAAEIRLCLHTQYFGITYWNVCLSIYFIGYQLLGEWQPCHRRMRSFYCLYCLIMFYLASHYVQNTRYSRWKIFAYTYLILHNLVSNSVYYTPVILLFCSLLIFLNYHRYLLFYYCF